ncbi:MAG: diguanylate cyclase [Chitinivibrionales bacterium]|nr:diguanylate cyclase [Chitinivibrionales bacterium]MBD3357186.1 diguanylate cyclase [Chitinivibrionales bacterium]
MKRLGHVLILILEITVYSALFGAILFFAAAKGNTVVSLNPLILGSVGGALLLCVTAGSLLWRRACLGFRSAVWVSLAVNAAVLLFAHPDDSLSGFGGHPVFLLLYSALIVVYAATRKPHIVLTVWCIYLLGEIAPLIIEWFVLEHTFPVDGAAWFSPLIPISKRAAMVTAMGTLAFAASYGRREEREGGPLQSTIHTPALARSTTETKRAEGEKESAESQPQPPSYSLNYIDELQSTATHDLDNILSSVVYFMSRNFRAYSSLGFVFDPRKQRFVLNAFVSKSMAVAEGIAVPLGKGIVGTVGARKRSFMSGDVTGYNQRIWYYTGNQMINSVLAVPIISGNGELVGALVIDSKDRSAFKDRDKEILMRFSTLAAALITNVRMRVHEEMTARQFKLLYDISSRFTSILETDKVLDALVAVLPRMRTGIRVLVMTFDEDAGRGVVAKVVGARHGPREGMMFPINHGVYSYVFTTAKPLHIEDLRTLPNRYYRFVPDETPDLRMRSLLVLPLGVDDRARCHAVVSIESEWPGYFRGETEQVLSTLVSNASVAYVRAMLYQRMVMLATVDGLTLLTNHRTFMDNLTHEVQRAQRYGRQLSLILMDIDHFKKFNDTYGHQIGDLVLREIAGCIRRAVRVNDLPARYGGEEFAVIVPETGPQSAVVTAERVRTTVESHVVGTDSHQLHVTVSLGCATMPTHADNVQSLINRADKALYYSKETGRNRVTLYRRGM